MTLDLYAKEDILNVLRALHVSSEVPSALAVDLLQDRELAVEESAREALAGQSALAQERMLSYQKGFRTAWPRSPWLLGWCLCPLQLPRRTPTRRPLGRRSATSWTCAALSSRWCVLRHSCLPS